jgi:hypothetical protein
MGLPEVSDRSSLRDFCKKQMDMGNKCIGMQFHHKDTKHIKQNLFISAICASVINQHVMKYEKNGNKLLTVQEKLIRATPNTNKNTTFIDYITSQNLLILLIKYLSFQTSISVFLHYSHHQL